MKERNPEIRPNPELPLFRESQGEQSFAKFEQARESLDEVSERVAFHREVAHARRSDPRTSHEAAASVVNLGRTRQAIIAILRVHPLTDEQLWEQYKLGMNAGITDFPKRTPSGLRSRRAELVRMGFVCEDGTGKTQAGRACAIWKLK